MNIDLKIVTVKDGAYGARDKNGSWNGMVGELIAGVSVRDKNGSWNGMVGELIAGVSVMTGELVEQCHGGGTDRWCKCHDWRTGRAVSWWGN